MENLFGQMVDILKVNKVDLTENTFDNNVKIITNKLKNLIVDAPLCLAGCALLQIACLLCLPRSAKKPPRR